MFPDEHALSCLAHVGCTVFRHSAPRALRVPGGGLFPALAHHREQGHGDVCITEIMRARRPHAGMGRFL